MTIEHDHDDVSLIPHIRIDYSPHRVNSSGESFIGDLIGSDQFETQSFGVPEYISADEAQLDELAEESVETLDQSRA